MDVARLENSRHALGISHGGEVTVVGRPDPAPARRIRSVVAGRLATRHGVVRGDGRIRLETLAVDGKTVAIEFRIGGCPHAHAVPGEVRLMTVNKDHSLGEWIATGLVAFAGRQRFYFRQKFRVDKFRGGAQPLAVGAECRMHVQAVASARAGFVFRLHGGIGIGHKDNAIEIAADKRFERSPQLPEFIGQILIERLLQIRDTDDGAALAQQQPLGRGVDDYVCHQPGKVHIIGPDGQQYEVEAAVRLLPVQGGHRDSAAH